MFCHDIGSESGVENPVHNHGYRVELYWLLWLKSVTQE